MTKEAEQGKYLPLLGKDQLAEIPSCLIEIKYNASVAVVRAHFLSSSWWNTDHIIQSGPQLHILFFHASWKDKHCSSAREEKTCQCAPHELQVLHTQDLGSVDLLQRDSHLHFSMICLLVSRLFAFPRGVAF